MLTPKTMLLYFVSMKTYGVTSFVSFLAEYPPVQLHMILVCQFSLFSSVSQYIQVIIDTYLTLIQNFIWVHKVACSFFFLILLVYLFGFGCTWSLLLCMDFSRCGE